MSETKSKNRSYFMGLMFSLDTMLSIIIPFIVGWFIVLGSASVILSKVDSYRIMFSIGLIILYFSGMVIQSGSYKNPISDSLVVGKQSKKWWIIRLFSFSIGLSDGLMFFMMTLLILSTFGHEGTLGTVSTIVALLVGALTYIYGRKANHTFGKFFFAYSLMAGIVGATILALKFSPISIGIYILLANILGYFTWLTSEPTVMDAIEREHKVPGAIFNQYFADRELFLNLGRYVAVGTFLVIHIYLSPQKALAFTPFVLYSAEAVLMVFVWKLLKVGSVYKLLRPGR